MRLFGLNLFGGAFGAGLVLVVLPSCALYFGMERLDEKASIGLPVMAIFGIMILFGALALTSTLFTRLGLGNRNEALALPSGSVRAAIALSLIVLFAIIAIMLFRTLAQPSNASAYRLRGLAPQDVNALYTNQRVRVLAVLEDACPAAPILVTPPRAGASEAQGTTSAASPPAGRCVSVDVLPSPGLESVDLAKQLLILIGTLMTSVTSFYFASANSPSSRLAAAPLAAPPRLEAGQQQGATLPPGDKSSAAGTTAAVAVLGQGAQAEEHADGCDVGAGEPKATPDDELPAATGGVS